MRNECGRLLLVFVLAVALTGCRREATPAETPTEALAAVDRVLELVRDRLALMPDVARIKWNAGRPVEDRDREEVLLRELEGKAAAHQLDPTFVRWFFAAQIEAAKQIQESCFREWRAEKRKSFENPPAFPELRKRIDTLNDELLAALAKLRPWQALPAVQTAIRDKAGQVVTGEGIDESVRAIAVRPLLKEK